MCVDLYEVFDSREADKLRCLFYCLFSESFCKVVLNFIFGYFWGDNLLNWVLGLEESLNWLKRGFFIDGCWKACMDEIILIYFWGFKLYKMVELALLHYNL